MAQLRSAAFDAALNNADRESAHRLEIDLPVWRNNLTAYPSPDGGTLGGWTGVTGMTLTSDATRSYVGRASLKASFGTSIAVGSTITPPAIPITFAGDSVAGSVRISADAALAGPVMAWWAFGDPAGNITGTSAKTSYTVPAGGTGGWITLSSVAAVPTGTTQAFFAIEVTPPTVAGTTNTLWIDALLVERSAAVGTYFDGDVDAATNLFSNPTAAYDLHDYVPVGVAVASDSGWSPDGAGGHSVALVPTAAVGSPTYVALGGDTGTALHSLAAGHTYTVSATVNVPAALAGVLNPLAASIAVLADAGGAATTFASAAGPVAGGTRRLSVTFTVPAGSSHAYVRLYHGGGAGAGIVRWGDVRIVESTDASWTAPRVSWDGVRQASTSRLNVAPYFDLSDAVDSVSVNRSVTTDLPDDVSLVTGYPAAAATIVLSGPAAKSDMDETRTAFWLFNPHNSASPLFGLDLTGTAVRHRAGLYTGQAMSGNPADPELLPTFTGTIDTIAVDNNAQSVTITCIDARNLLRSAVDLPAIAYQTPPFNTWAAQSGGMNPGLLGSWCIDFLLRSNGIHSSPPPRAQCLAYLSGNGSAWPDVMGPSLNSNTFQVQQDPMSYTDATTSRYPVGAPTDYLNGTIAGPWHSQCVPGPIVSSAPMAGGATVSMTTGGSFFFEGDMYVRSDVSANAVALYAPAVLAVSSDRASRFGLLFDAQTTPGTVSVGVYAFKNNANSVLTPTGVTFPTDTWHHVAAQVTWASATSITVTLWLDYATTPTTFTATGMASGAITATAVDIQCGIGYLDSVQVTAETNALPAAPFVPRAYLDPSLNALAATVEIAGADPWATIQALAEAEVGFAGFDEVNVFRFLNRATLAAAAPTRPSDAAIDLTAFSTQAQRSAVVTHVTASTAGWTSSAAPGTVWSASTAIRVPRRGTYSVTINLDAPAAAPLVADTGYASSALFAGATQWRAAKNAVGTGGVFAGITVTPAMLSPQVLQLTITNSNPFDVWMVSDTTKTDVTAGTPFLNVAGILLAPIASPIGADSQWPPAAAGGAAANPAGDVVLALADNPWQQDPASVQTLTDDLLAMLYKPRHTWQNVAIAGDPAVQLADRKRVTDTDAGLNDDAYVFGVTFEASDSSWSSTLTMRAAASPGGWVLGTAGRSEMGVATTV